MLAEHDSVRLGVVSEVPVSGSGDWVVQAATSGAALLKVANAPGVLAEVLDHIAGRLWCETCNAKDHQDRPPCCSFTLRRVVGLLWADGRQLMATSADPGSCRGCRDCDRNWTQTRASGYSSKERCSLG